MTTSGAGPRDETERVLIVDDQQDSIDLLSLLLSTYLPQLELLSCTTGAEAIELVRDEHPHLVLLDVKMPEMDGYEVCRTLKADPATVEIPVLMVSGVLTSSKHRTRGLDVGAEGYICKPFEPSEFIAQVRSLLRLKRSRDDLRRREQNLEDTLQQRTGALRESEEKFRLLFERSPDAIFVEDVEGVVLDANPAACRLHDLSRAELIGRHVTDLVPEEARATVRREFPKWFTGELTEFQGLSWRSDGIEVPVEVRASLVSYQNRRAVLLHVRDITDRRRTERQLSRAEEKYRALVEQLPAITYVVDLGPPSHTVYISPQVLTLLGVQPKDWTSSPDLWVRRLHPEDRQRVIDEVARQDRVREPFALEYRMVSRSGRIVWFRNQGLYLRDETTDRWSIHGVMVDVTARKEAEEALRKSEEQLRQSQKMEALGRLSGGIAHDFNNLLTSILGYGRLIDDEPGLAAPLREHLGEIIHAGERAEELVRQLLAFSHKQVMDTHPLDLNEIVADMDRLLRRTLGEDVELVTLPHETPCMIEADSGQLGQVIMNLAVNARHAMPAGGKLTVRTAVVRLGTEFCRTRRGLEPGLHALLEVADTGCGMTPEVREHAFEPFYTTREKGRGTGLGLATVYGIVTQSKGCIDLETAPGEGARFRIYFPALHGKTARLKVRERGTAPGGQETILLAEDESSVRRLAQRLLSSVGYRVIESVNGVEALQAYEEHQDEIALVVSDIVMPQMGGIELVTRLRRLRPELRILFITGFAQESFIQGSVPGAPVPVLLKPFSRDQLARKVRETLDRPATSVTPPTVQE